MRIPTYRKHSSGQARVSINGRDYLLGRYGSKESKVKYNRLVGEWIASDQSKSFGVPVAQLTVSRTVPFVPGTERRATWHRAESQPVFFWG